MARILVVFAIFLSASLPGCLSSSSDHAAGGALTHEDLPEKWSPFETNSTFRMGAKVQVGFDVSGISYQSGMAGDDCAFAEFLLPDRVSSFDLTVALAPVDPNGPGAGIPLIIATAPSGGAHRFEDIHSPETWHLDDPQPGLWTLTYRVQGSSLNLGVDLEFSLQGMTQTPDRPWAGPNEVGC